MINEFEFVYSLVNIKGFGKKKVADYIIEHCCDLEMCIMYKDFILDENLKSIFEFNVLKAKKIEDDCVKKNIKIITIFNPLFPSKLYSGKEPCLYLFYFGDVNLLNQKSIAVIGSRKVDNEFLEKSLSIIKEIVNAGFVVVSGLAIGCDTFAHEKCIENGGKTIAVLPSPINDIQPKQNIELARQIAKNNSLIISEYPPFTPYNKFNYPERDRIQSMLSDKVFVIQASENSGTMICVKRSISDKKRVFALKGNNLSLINNYIDSEDPASKNDLLS